MEKNLNWLDRLMRFILAAILIFAAIVLFKHPVVRILVWAGAVFSLWEGFWARCYLTAHLGSRSMGQRLQESSLYLLGLVAIQIAIAYEWWSGGWEKISSPEFVNNINKTFGFFASNNPFSWYKDFLLGFATNNGTLFANAVQWGEAGVGVALAVFGILFVYSKNSRVQKAALYLSILALLGGMLMNINFYLAASWTGPGTRGINITMFWTQAVLACVWLYRANQLE